ncbi:MAG: hypothetical protein ABIS06_16345 [Vicinamibacterales bacterium]
MNRHRFALACLLALLLIGISQAQLPPPIRKTPPGGDIVLFRAVVERLRAGEPYYAAMRSELRSRAYPTASIFNWRPPATFLFLAKAPGAAHVAMVGLAAVAIALTVLVFRNAPPLLTIIAVLLQIGGVLLPAIPTDGLYMPETWTGIFILLSVLSYTLGAVRCAVCSAIAAICARELALPYVAACCGLALYERRTEELRWYAIGLCVFVAYYGIHAVMATSHTQAGDMAHTYSWIAFGGWQFVVQTVAMGGWFLMLAPWTAAVGAVVVLASLWGPADRHLKALVLIYLFGFCVVGQSFNTYWGLMTGPSWGLGIPYGLIGVHRLIKASIRALPGAPLETSAEAVLPP